MINQLFIIPHIANFFYPLNAAGANMHPLSGIERFKRNTALLIDLQQNCGGKQVKDDINIVFMA